MRITAIKTWAVELPLVAGLGVTVEQPCLTVMRTISGPAWMTGTSRLMLDPDHPRPTGYRLSDTWRAWTD